MTNFIRFHMRARAFSLFQSYSELECVLFGNCWFPSILIIGIIIIIIISTKRNFPTKVKQHTERERQIDRQREREVAQTECKDKEKLKPISCLVIYSFLQFGIVNTNALTNTNTRTHASQYISMHQYRQSIFVGVTLKRCLTFDLI